VRPALILLALLPIACRGTPPEAPPPTAGASPSVAEIGLEVRVWSVHASRAPVLGLFAPHALAESRLGPGERARWRASGFRLVEIPVPDAEALESVLPHADAVRRLALGQPTRWTRLAGTPPARAGDTPTDPLELVTRAWPEPHLREGRVFRVELALVDPSGADAPLLLSHTLPEGLALAIVPAAPDEDWIAPAPEPAGDGIGTGPDPGDTPPETGGIAPLPAPGAATPTPPEQPAPLPPPPRTAGEAMLITPARPAPHPRPPRREVIVLIPRWRS
jgi:hypothetical protein